MARPGYDHPGAGTIGISSAGALLTSLAPGWERFDRAGRTHPTAAAAVAAFRGRASRL